MPTQTQIDTYLKNNYGVVNINNRPAGRPPLPQSKDEEIRARIEPDTLKEVMAFCAGRRITRSDYIRGVISLDTEYFDHISSLNDPEVKQLIFSALRLAKKI